MMITNCKSNPPLSNILAKATTYMSKELVRIYPNLNPGDRKGRTRHINIIGRGQGVRSGYGGRGGVRGLDRGQGGGCGTCNIYITTYMDGKYTHFPQ